MDELRLIETFRQDVEDPDVEASSRAWSTVETRMRHSSWSSTGSMRRRRAIRLGLVTGAAAIAVSLLLLIPLLVPQRASPAAAQALLVAAKAAEDGPYHELQPGEYYYSRSRGANMAFVGGDPETSYALQIPETKEAWLGGDGSARIVIIKGTPRFLSGHDRARWKAAGSDPYLWEHPDNSDLRLSPDENVFPFGRARALSYEELIALPADPSELLERIDAAARASGQDLDYKRFVVIGDLLRGALLPPELEGATYRLAAMIPGIELIGEVRDPEGRPGVAVGFVHGGIRHDLIFDPDTGRLLAERYVVDEPLAETGAAVGTVIGYSAYGFEDGIVSSTSERPPGVAPIDTGGACVGVIEGSGDPTVPQPIIESCPPRT